MLRNGKIQKLLSTLLLFIIVGCSGGADEVPSLLTIPDTEAPTITTVTPPVDGTFIYNQNLSFSVQFSEAVYVTGTPQVELVIDGSNVSLPYISGNGSSTLIFNKNIDFERLDADGIDLNQVLLNGGTIRDAAGNNADLTITPVNYPLKLVDSIRPVLTSVIFNAAELYTQNSAAVINSVVSGADEILASTASDCSTGAFVPYNSALPYTLTDNSINDVYVQFQTFAGNKTACTQITITHDNLIPNDVIISQIGDATTGQTDTASWTTTTDNGPAGILKYEYAVSTSISPLGIIAGGGWVDVGVSLGHQITSGVAIAPLTNYYTLVKIIDNAGNEKITAGPAWQISTPDILTVTPPADDTYNLGEILIFTANTNKNVTVTGTPRIQLDIGGVTRYANYVPGASTATALSFQYTVVSGDNDADGIAHFSPVQLNGGTIEDALSNSADLNFTPADTTSVLVDDYVPPTQLVITTQPVDTAEGANINPAITVELRDGTNTLVAGATDNVTIAFGTDPSAGAATLSGTLTVAAVGGIATFNDINIDTAFAGYTLTVTSGVLTPDTSNAFEIFTSPIITSVTPPADDTYYLGEVLTFTANTNKDVTVTGTPRIQLDIGGVTRYANYIPGSSTATALSFQYTIVSGDTDADGIGHLSPVDLNGGTIDDVLSNNLDLTFTPADTSNVLVVDYFEPTNLVITTQPVDTAQGINISPAITVELRDATDTLVAGATDNVTISFGTDPSAGAASLAGTLTVAAVGGIATFSDINIDTAFAGYTLMVTSGILTADTSNTFEITPVPVLTSVTPPLDNTYNISEDLDFVANYDRNVNVTGTPRIQLDIGGVTRYADYIPGASTPTALTFRYTTQAGDNDADGIEHFSPIDLNSGTIVDSSNANDALLTFTPADTSAVLVSTTIVATKLVFVDQPTNSVAGVDIAPAITVELRDNLENLDTNATDNVTLTFGTDPSAGSATIGGTVTVAAIAGVATFSNINIDKAFTGYTLSAGAAGLTSGVSSSFDISPAAKAKLGFSVEPNHTDISVIIAPAFTVEIQDAFGNKTNDTDTITIAIGTDPSTGSAILSGSLSASAVAGELSFSDIAIDQYGVGYDLIASAAGLTSATSASFDVNAPPVKLGFQVQPSDSSSSVTIAPAIKVEVQDASGNLVSTATGSITIAFQTDPSAGSAVLAGTLTQTIVSGVATFADIDVDLAFADYTLLATSAGLTSAVSTPFDIIPSAPTSLTLIDPLSSPNSDSTPTIQVAGVENGDVVKIFTDSGCTNEVVGFTAAGATVDITTTSLADGTYTFYANRTNTNSAISLCSTASLAYEVLGALDQLDSLDVFGNWSNVGGDDRDWTQNTGGTPSVDIGPTTGFGGSGGYAYTEASGGVGALEEFHLESNTLDGSIYDLAIDFKWNKRGSDMGDLYLEASNNGGSTWAVVWSHIGMDMPTGPTDAWRSQNVDLCTAGYTASNVKLRFRGVMPNGGTIWNSDIAIDELHVNSGGCAPNPPATIDMTNPIAGTIIELSNHTAFTVGGFCSDNGQNVTLSGDVSGVTTCSGNAWSIVLDLSAHADGTINMIADHSAASGGANGSVARAFTKDANTFQFDDFETLGNWSNVVGDDRDWTQNNGDTPSANVGPTSGSGGSGGYLYTEASNPVVTNDEFYLVSNDLPAGTYNLQITFDWNKRGNTMGDLYLEVSTDGGTNWDAPLWSHLGVDIATGSPDVWNTQTVDLCNAGYIAGNIKVRLRAVMPSAGTVWNSDIGIDSAKVTVDGCP